MSANRMIQNIIITMAGLGTRFTAQGYTQPKYMIEVNGKSLFEWAVSSLSNLSAHSRWHFVMLKSHDAADFVERQCRSMKMVIDNLVELDRPTSGQAESAMKAAVSCDPTSPCLIYNIDTHVRPNALRPEDIKGDGWIPCFDVPGDHWSFVRIGKDGYATEVREKERISHMCSIGLYWFRTTASFVESYRLQYTQVQKHSSETYIAPLYNQLIENGLQISANLIQADMVVPLGTPEELRCFEAINQDI